MQLTHHVDLVIPVTSSTPNRHTHATIRVADACRDQSSPIATRITLNTGSAKTRHTAGTTMVRSGEDIVTVAEILGHSVETARRYSLPTEHDKQRAIQRIPVDE